MFTRLTIRRFKGIENVSLELGNPVVFIGPNNSGKTSAMQALALWDFGLRRWREEREGQGAPKKRSGVTLDLRDIPAIPVPDAALLWPQTRTRSVRKVAGSRKTDNIRIEIIVEGVTDGKSWRCGLEFDYANRGSLYCRPLRTGKGKSPKRMPVPGGAGRVPVTFLPPMSGLGTTERRLGEGAVNARLGKGRAAEVLRNLCCRVLQQDPDGWEALAGQIQSLFGVELDAPRHVKERREIVMGYREGGARLDLSSSGRGLQQILLTLAYLRTHPGAVILLDEPDAHLELSCQRQAYNLLSETAVDHGSQAIVASHSEVLFNEVVGRDAVIVFAGQPHRMGKEAGKEALKALQQIGYEPYCQAKQNGWVLYLEGSTDLAALRAFARRLGHESAQRALERPFVHYVGNQPETAGRHYCCLRRALPELHGVALFDHLEFKKPKGDPLRYLIWRRREIENYFCTRATLMAYAREFAPVDQAAPQSPQRATDSRVRVMEKSISEVEEAFQLVGAGSPWRTSVKVSDDFLKPLFYRYCRRLGRPHALGKKYYHRLVQYIPDEEIAPEITKKLDMIAEAAERARSRRSR